MNLGLSAQRAFTLIELLVVVALIAVLMSLAAPAMQNVRTNVAVSDAASNLYLSIQQAQGSALKFNRNVIVAPITSKDWSSGWRVFVRRDTNNTYDAGTDTQVSYQEPTPSFVTVASTTTCEDLILESSGFLKNTVNNCRVVFGSAETKNYKHVIVAKSGRPRVCTSNSAAVASCPD